MDLETLLPLMKLTSGRRIAVFMQMRTIARDLNQPVLDERIERALDHDVQTRDFDNQWAEPTRRSLYTPGVQRMDRYVDIGITSLRDLTTAQVRGLPSGHPLVVEADEMLGDILPAGVGAVTSLPYIEQVAASEVIVSKLQNRWSGAVDRLGLTQRVAFLADYTNRYRRLINEHRNLTFAEVEHYREIGQRNLREVVILAVATYLDSSDPAQVAARERLLEPLAVQLDDMHERARARRKDGSEDGTGEDGTGEDGTGDGEIGEDAIGENAIEQALAAEWP